MLKNLTVFAGALILGLGVLGVDVPSKTTSTSGSWQVDARHSDASIVTDATTDYGKTKINVTLGFARVNGAIKLDDGDPGKSRVDFRIYPATSMSPIIGEDGKFLTHWLENQSNQTLVCFHSKKIVRTPDGHLQATGELAVTRVDRNVEMTPNEAYAGPVYGPPMIHRVSREATFVFDFPASNGTEVKGGSIKASGSTSMVREDFPQLVSTVVSTYWPPLVQDEKCQLPAASEAYSGSQCTGTYMSAPGLPEPPQAASSEDIGARQNFNNLVGNHLTLLVNLRLAPNASGQQTAALN